MVLPSTAIVAFNGIDAGRLYPLARLHPGHIAKLRRVCDVRDGRLVVAWSPSGRPSLRDNARHIKDPERRAILDELKLLRDAVFTRGFACNSSTTLTVEIPIDGNSVVGCKVLVNGHHFIVWGNGIWSPSLA